MNTQTTTATATTSSDRVIHEVHVHIEETRHKLEQLINKRLRLKGSDIDKVENLKALCERLKVQPVYVRGRAIHY